MDPRTAERDQRGREGRETAGTGPGAVRPSGPLSRDELARAGRVARRMQAELARVVEDLPPPARSATGMARHLDLVRNTCQRVVTAVGDAEPGPRLLGRLPGVQGLRQFIDAIRAAGVDEARSAAASAAVDEFEAAVHELAGSQSRLIQRLEATEEPEEGSDEEIALASLEARRRLYEGAVGCVGRSLRVHLSILAFRRSPDRDGKVESFAVTGLIGFRSRPDGMPVVLEYGDTTKGVALENRNRVKMLDEAPAVGSTPRAVLEAFSTSPPPIVLSRDENGDLYQTIEPAGAEDGGPLDVVLAHRSAFVPQQDNADSPPLEHIWALINTPARHFLLDVYLDKDLASECVPSVDAQLWMQDLQPRMPWATRLPHAPRLEFLGLGAAERAGEEGGGAPGEYPRHNELTAHIFQKVGWPAREFVGYRCAMPYPIWRAGYRMTFRSLA